LLLFLLFLQGDHDRRPNSFLADAPSHICAVYGPTNHAHQLCLFINNTVTFLLCLRYFLQGDHDRRPNSFLVYAPSRTCAVYGPADWADPEADRKPAGVPGLGIKELGPYYEY
jgi:hypothetical protein